ncbi:MAG: hypothetical protein ACFCUJ_14215 [Thiotrichales bacterium]
MKAIIGITRWTDTSEELRALARRVNAGERLPETDYHLNFASPVDLLSALPLERLRTLREIKTAGPLSVYRLAKRLGRNYSNVHADVKRLVELSLVEQDTNGVSVPFEDIVVRVDASLMAA